MKVPVDISDYCKKNIPLFIGMCLCFYFSYHLILGQYSYPKLLSLHPIVTEKSDKLDSLKIKTSILEGKVTLMRPATFSPDLMEEQIRYILGYNKNGEVVILSR